MARPPHSNPGNTCAYDRSTVVLLGGRRYRIDDMAIYGSWLKIVAEDGGGDWATLDLVEALPNGDLVFEAADGTRPEYL